MVEELKDDLYYPIPYKVRSKFKISMHLLFIVIISIFAASSFIRTNDMNGIILKYLSPILVFMLAIPWIYTGILKKGYIELSDEGICIKTIFSTQKIKWIDIYNVFTTSTAKNGAIHIISKQSLKKKKASILHSFTNLFTGKDKFIIPLQMFPDVKPEKLFSTIVFKVQNTAQSTMQIVEDEIDINVDTNESVEYDFTSAFIKALFVSILVGVLYGISIFVFKCNFYVIPMLGMIGIMYVYYKGHKGKVSFIKRFIVGVLYVLQVIIAPFTVIIISNFNYIKNGFGDPITIFISTLKESPGEYFVYYLIAFILFVFGLFSGASYKFIRILKKFFMKKKNGFYVVRDGRVISIFVIDYEDYDKNIEKVMLRILPNECLIEREKKKIFAFYLPAEIMKKNQINAMNYERIKINEKSYYKFDLGGIAKREIYGYSPVLVMNNDRQIEVISLEID
jgi:hypothetical protein